MVYRVGCGVGFARLLGFFFFADFFLLVDLGFFREPSKRERVGVVERESLG